MDKRELQQALGAFMAGHPENLVSPALALDKNDVGKQMFENSPLLGVAAARDPLFAGLKKPEVVGPFTLLPEEWLPGAQTVVSFFLPYTQEVKHANAADMDNPVNLWRNARIDGQAFLVKVCLHLADLLRSAGGEACIPVLDTRFRSGNLGPEKDSRAYGISYASNWSERHTAYICGLGTFSLNRGLITEKGICGRFGSIITTLPLEPDIRPYSGIYDYCTHCGACARNCPANAINPALGKHQGLCSDYLDDTALQEIGYYGCGKCQVGIPCENGIPRPKP